MEQTIFNKGNGWYISASNYKDQNDKCYISLFFPHNTDPWYEDNGRGFSVKVIDIEKAKFTSYKGKAGLTIFKYTEPEVRTDNQPKEAVETITRQQNESGGGYEEIKQDDLPFY